MAKKLVIFIGAQLDSDFYGEANFVVRIRSLISCVRRLEAGREPCRQADKIKLIQEKIGRGLPMRDIPPQRTTSLASSASSRPEREDMGNVQQDQWAPRRRRTPWLHGSPTPASRTHAPRC